MSYYTVTTLTCISSTPPTSTGDSSECPPNAFSDPGAWNILRQFASTEMTLPQAETALTQHLGNQYKDSDWRPALKAVMDAEGDVPKAQKAVQILSAACGKPKITIKLPPTRPPQLVAAEENLANSIKVLHQKNRIFGQLPTVEELVNPVEERENSLDESPYAFPGGDKEIVQQVMLEQQVAQGEIMD